MSGDAVDALHQVIARSSGSDRALQDLLEMYRHEQIAGAMHRQHRTFDSTVERHDLIVWSHGGAHFGVRLLASHRRVQTIGGETERFVDRVLDVRRHHRAIGR